MSKRALLKFRNPDSTQDINDRFAGLFDKGVFSGGNVTPVSGTLRVDVGVEDSTHEVGFSTTGSDGMFVREDSETTRLDVVAGVKNYIVIRQQYISNGDPIASVESLTEVEFNSDGAVGEQGVDNPNLIVFGTVDLDSGATSVTSNDIVFYERNTVDPLGRLVLRGSVTEESDLPGAGLGVNRDGDFYMVVEGPTGGDGEPALFAWDGTSWFNMTNAGVVLELLNEHQANLNEDEKHLTDMQANAMESTTGLGSDAVPAELAYPIPLTETAVNYASQTSEFENGETITGASSAATGVIAFDSTPAIGDGTLGLKSVSGDFVSGEIVSGDGASPGDRATLSSDAYANRVVAQQDPKIPTQDENDALAGNWTGASDDLETGPPSDTNRFVTSSKVLAVPTETTYAATSDIELDVSAGEIFVGRPDDPEATSDTVRQWFNLYDLNEQEDTEYINTEFQPVKITEIQTGPPGGSGTSTLDPQTSGNVDALGFFTPTAGVSLYIITDNETDSDFRVSYGKKSDFASVLPQLFMDRGPKGGQIDTRLQQLLLGTPNAQFTSVAFEGSVTPGQVVAWNQSLGRFEAADPDGGLTPVGVRGNSNNVVQEGLFEATSPIFTPDMLYADKANPGSLTNTPNEWFIGTAISTTQLMVNMNAISLEASGEVVPPVTFPVDMFSASLQPGQPAAWSAANSQFEEADPDDPLLIPLGVRGNDNNVIQSSKYTSASGSPFTGGTRYYFGRSSLGQNGQLVTQVNDWPAGVGIDSVTLLVNSTNFPIPRNFFREHDSESGYHTFQSGNGGERDSIVDPETGNPLGAQHTGMLFLRTDTDPPRIDYWNGAAWEAATSDRIDVPSGTKMLFIQDTVPTGWTFDASLNDRVVSVTDTLGLGGTIGGTWTISGLTADSHAITINEMPSHQHDIEGGGGGDENVNYNDNGPDGSSNYDGTPNGRPTELEGGGAGHTHSVSSDGAWRPNLVYAIVCTRD